MNENNRGKCKFCGKELRHVFANLGTTPVANSYVDESKQFKEDIFPLCAYVCEDCKLVQLEEYETPEDIFTVYAYFSSMSADWLRQCKQYSETMITKYGIGKQSFVAEIASNDGYLLTNFVERGVPVLGIEPAQNVARIAREKGVNTLCAFFGEETSKQVVEQYGKADLIIGNNVLAHVPNIHDFSKGMKNLLGEHAVITMEFPHLLQLMQKCQFDTIYHEHFYYYSLLTVRRIFAFFGLTIFDVEELPTHGGSIRIYARHTQDNSKPVTPAVENLLAVEAAHHLDDIATYLSFGETVKQVKRDTLAYLIEQKNNGKRIAAFGAPAKGNTFLNYCGIGCDFIDFTVDDTPYKQGLCLPGVRIPIFPPQKLMEEKPDIVLILPWNWADEIVKKLAFVKEYGGELVTLIPQIKKY